ncbi:hypothetical protein FOMPIDRAFT_84498 [Fomitopsis schrenkii]|uniref:Uncharacterized protein n=1 Tax=Fomitopsis schrenkii TaxID=2126942 RepID=S8G254_FOMSC|nr:hypothetical protein FOMPIDRAFT_84498 [Fomitopsis schrenkii]
MPSASTGLFVGTTGLGPGARSPYLIKMDDVPATDQLDVRGIDSRGYSGLRECLG